MLRVFLVCLGLVLAGLSSAAWAVDDVGRGSGRKALVIGNSNYRNTSVLPNSVNDARSMAQALRSLNFEVMLGTDVDGSRFRDMVARFSRDLRPGDVSLLYYAGHGLQADGENFLLPVDAELRRPSDLALETERLQDIIGALTAESNTAIVLLDACRDNPIIQKLSSSNATRSISIGKGLSAFDAGRGVFIGFATQPGNVAYDGATEHSPFTAALLRHIATPSIDVEILMRRVRMDVMARTGGLQIPWSNSSLVEPGFSFKPSATAIATPLAPNDLGTATDLEFWQSVKDLNDISMLRAYLAAFPKGAFADIARNRIEKLVVPPPAIKKKAVPTTRNAAPKPKPSTTPRNAVPKSKPSASTSKKASPVTRTAEPKPQAAPAAGGRCRDGNIERCRQNCREGRRGACRMLRSLGG